MDFRLSRLLCTLAMAGASLASAQAEEKVLNLYSARHYQTDEALYNGFTRQTGITIKRIEGKEDELLERIRNEGANSPADVLLTVDAARLAAAHETGLLAPVRSAVLETRIPAHLRTDDWFAFRSARASSSMPRVRSIPTSSELQRSRQSSAERQDLLTLGFASLQPVADGCDHCPSGRGKSRGVGKGVVANFARPPKGATPIRSGR
jgi:iron(III) transport system substrate-binding protein